MQLESNQSELEINFIQDTQRKYPSFVLGNLEDMSKAFSNDNAPKDKMTEITVDGQIQQTAIMHNTSGGENDKVQISNEPREG